MAYGVQVEIVRSTLRSTSGTQDFTFTGIGTPKAAIVIFVRTSINGSATTDLGFSLGMTDGTRQRVGAVAAEHTGSTSTGDCYTAARTDNLIYGLDPASGAVDHSADFDSWVTDGIRLDVTRNEGFSPPGYFVTVILFAGDDLSTYVDDMSTFNLTQDITDPGFEPDNVITYGVGTAFGIAAAAQTDLLSTIGFCDNDLTQYTVSKHTEDSVYPGRSAGYVDLDEVYRSVTDSAAESGLGLFGFDSSGFSNIVLDAGTATINCMYLALAYNNTLTGHSVHSHTPQTSTGEYSDTNPGFEPQFVMGCGSNLQSLGTKNSGALSGPQMFICFTDSDEFSNVIYTRDNNTVDTGCFTTNANAVHMRSHVGTLGWRAEFVSMDSTGFTLDYVNAAPNTRYLPMLTIGIPRYTAAGAGTLPSLEGSGTGTVTNEATGAGDLPSLTASGTGQLQNSGSADGILPVLTASGAATLKVEGTGAGVLPSLTGAGTGVLKVEGSAAGTLPSLTGAGTGTVANTAVGAGVLPTLGAAGTGTLTHSGTAAGNLPALEAAGTGTLTITGTGAATLPSLDATGAGNVGAVVISGSGAGNLPALEAAGTGTVKNEAAGAATLPSLIGAATGTVKNEATGAGIMPSMTASGTGTVKNEATGAATLPSLTGAGTGILTVSGAGAGVLPSLTGAGTGSLNVSGAAAGVLPSLEAAGTASIQITGAAAGILPSLEAAGTGNVAAAGPISGAGVGILPTLTATGIASVSIPGSGAGILPSLEASGAAMVVDPNVMCSTALTGSFVTSTILTGSFVTTTSVTGSFVDQTSLTGSFITETALTGSFVDTTALEGSFCDG